MREGVIPLLALYSLRVQLTSMSWLSLATAAAHVARCSIHSFNENDKYANCEFSETSERDCLSALAQLAKFAIRIFHKREEEREPDILEEAESCGHKTKQELTMIAQ